MSYARFNINDTTFFNNENKAKDNLFSALARSGGEGSLYSCVLELGDTHYYALKLSKDAPKNINTSTGCPSKWKKVHCQSIGIMFHHSDAITINDRDINNRCYQGLPVPAPGE